MARQKKTAEELEAERALWADYHKTKNNDLRQFTFELAKDGFRYAVLAHSAVGLLAFNAMGAFASAIAKQYLVAVMICSLVGLVMAAGGVVLFIEISSDYVGRAESRLIRRGYSWASLLAVTIYSSRFYTVRYRLAGRLIYGSFLWLIVYVFAAIVGLAQP